MAKKLSQAEIEEEIRLSSLYIGYGVYGQRYGNLEPTNGFFDSFDPESSERVSTRHRGTVTRPGDRMASKMDADDSRRRSAKEMYKMLVRSGKRSERKISNKVR